MASFFGSLLGSIFDRSLIGFWSQLGPQNGAKSSQNRFQDAFLLAYHFRIDFSSIFEPILDPQILKNRAPAAARARFSKNRSSKLISIFDPMLVPTWLHFGSQNRPKSTKNPISKGIEKLIDFCIDFWSFLAPFWKPSWGHLGHFFRKKRAPG